MISRFRFEAYGDWHTQIMMAPLLHAADDDSRLFLQFYNRIPIEGRMEVMIGWANPSLLMLSSRANLNIFVDCTFSICPVDFAQCMILMIYDEPTRLYIPIFYVLLQSKFQETYEEALRQICRSTGHAIHALSITCDFEIGLFNAVKKIFPDATPALCIFHFKQAIHRKLKKLGIATNDQGKLLRLLDILTVIDPLTIKRTGIFFLRNIN